MQAMPRRFSSGRNLGNEAAVLMVEDAHRHLAGVPLVVGGQHALEDVRTLVSGEADVAHFALRLGDLGGLDGAARLEDPLRVVVVVDLVELPEVQVVGAQAAQALVELFQGAVARPIADLRHEEDVVAMVGQDPAVAALAETFA